MKTREFIRDFLAPVGAVLHKKDGDHHVYALPNGRKFVVPMGGCHTECKPYLISKLRRLLGESVGEEEKEGTGDASG